MFLLLIVPIWMQDEGKKMVMHKGPCVVVMLSKHTEVCARCLYHSSSNVSVFLSFLYHLLLSPPVFLLTSPLLVLTNRVHLEQS